MANNSKLVGVLILILLLASFLRLYSLNSAPPGLYSDEATNGNNAVQALEAAPPDGGFRAFYAENNGREGLFINIQAIFIKLIGSTGLIGPIEILRLPSALFGILTVLGVYFLTKELFGDKRIALFAAFLIATSFWHINFSRIGFRAIMAPAFLTWGLYLLLLSYSPRFAGEAGKSYRSYWTYLLPLLAGAVYGLGMHSYIAYRATPLLIVFSLWLLGIRHGWKRTLKIGAIFIVASIIVFLPLGFYFLENPADFFGRTSQISVWQSPTPLKDLGLNILKTAGMFSVAGDYNPRHNIPGSPLLYWPVGILFLMGIFVGIKKLTQNSILFAWLVVSALPVIISNEGMPHALRAILMAPPVFILAALGGAWLYEKIRSIGPISLIGPIGLIFLIVFSAVNAYTSYFIDWAKRPDVASAFNQDIVRVAEEMNKLPPETPKYLIIDTGGHDVRKIGSPAQTIMYLTDTYLPEKQKERNIFYISPSETSKIPENGFVIEI
ncbi:MAG: glycosyltransferase family 39 protein [Candidatus Jorgensenbacteria bacterium]